MTTEADKDTSDEEFLPRVELDDDAPIPEFTSALYDHCVTVYNAMNETATDTPEGRVWEGALTNLFNELGLGIAYYTQITRKLKAMDCIRQLSRGGGPTPSRWFLMQPPNVNLYALPDKVSRVGNTRRSSQVAAQQARDLNARLSRLEDWARNQGAPV